MATVGQNASDIKQLEAQVNTNTTDLNNAKSNSKTINQLDSATLANDAEFTVQLNSETELKKASIVDILNLFGLSNAHVDVEVSNNSLVFTQQDTGTVIINNLAYCYN